MQQNVKMGRYPRCWGWMPTLDAYIFREFMVKFFILLLVSTILFFLGDVLNDLSDFLDNEAPFAVYSRYFLLKIPGNIRFVLPITTLLGCMWTMAMFGKNQEVTAMRASGISLFRCGSSILLVGLLTTFVNIWFNEALIPYTEREAVQMMAVATGDTQRMTLEDQKLTYRSPDKRRTWLFQLPNDSDAELGAIDQDGKQHEVSVKFYRTDGTMEKDLVAQNVVYVEDEGWRFEDVSITGYTEDGLFSKATEHFKEWMLSVREAPETPINVRYSVKSVEDLPSWLIFDLVHSTKDMSKRARNLYWTAFFYRMSFPWSCFLAVFLGIPLATKSERNGILSSIITAVVVIVCYMALAQGFLAVGKQGYFHPLIAGFGPTFAFCVYGIYTVIHHQS